MKIAIYGYGSSGRKLSDIISCGGGDGPLFIDRNAADLRRKHPSLSIYTLEEFIELNQGIEIDGILVSTESPEVSEDIFRELWLKRVSFPVGYAPFSRFEEGFDKEHIVWLKNKIFLARLVVHLADSCNLRCKGCSHFANLFDKESMYETDILLDDFFRIASKVYAPCVYLLGGEPLLNPCIGDIVCNVREIFPRSDIEIVTNGLLITELKENLLTLLYRNRVRFSITQYPPTSKIRDEIEKILKEHEIRYHITDIVESFRACFSRSERLSDGKVSQKRCGADYCRFIRYGKLYKCPVSGMVYKYNNIFGRCFPDDEGIDIDAPNFKELALKMCNPIELCKFCAEEPRMFAWKQSLHPTEDEWCK